MTRNTLRPGRSVRTVSHASPTPSTVAPADDQHGELDGAPQRAGGARRDQGFPHGRPVAARPDHEVGERQGERHGDDPAHGGGRQTRPARPRPTLGRPEPVHPVGNPRPRCSAGGVSDRLAKTPLVVTGDADAGQVGQAFGRRHVTGQRVLTRLGGEELLRRGRQEEVDERLGLLLVVGAGVEDAGSGDEDERAEIALREEVIGDGEGRILLQGEHPVVVVDQPGVDLAAADGVDDGDVVGLDRGSRATSPSRNAAVSSSPARGSSRR